METLCCSDGWWGWNGSCLGWVDIEVKLDGDGCGWKLYWRRCVGMGVTSVSVQASTKHEHAIDFFEFRQQQKSFLFV